MDTRIDLNASAPPKSRRSPEGAAARRCPARVGKFCIGATIALFLGVGAGCLPRLSTLPPAHDFRGGDQLVAIKDTWMLETMGGVPKPKDHRRASAPRRRLPVVLAGAQLEIPSDFEQRRNSSAPGATNVEANPWILVNVVHSPMPAQNGWQGWIHVDTVAAPGRAAVESAPKTVGLTRAARLCRAADSLAPNCIVQSRPTGPRGRVW